MSTLDQHSLRVDHRARARALLRVAAYLLTVCSVLLLWSARAAYAELEQTVLGFGHKVVAELGPSLVGSPQLVTLNGQPMFLGATSSTLSVHQVLDAFAANCRAGARDIGSLLGVHGKALLQSEPAEGKWMRALDQARVLRVENESEGMLGCLAPSQARHDDLGLVEGLRAFMESGDLSTLGDLRYVTARRDPAGHTQVIAVWTEGRFLLSSIFPETGDVPGSDLIDVPRPFGAVRSVCATAPGRAFSYRLYESGQPASDVLAFYDQRLVQSGWSRVVTVDDSAGSTSDPLTVRAFLKNGRALGIGIDRDPQGKTQISLVDMAQVAHVEGASP